ncbi:hypothetical protein [Streptomyces regalis]|uniref:Uncharacterized protein n=1 Tax=Streptomyces regalis TaxID=68262 RepID=A0A0X3UX12_9ACTN|nr:hypothetical protein [Streptomyces regalis]KUL37065.1 hypothetical protein ADL12_18845 [Streptomyces regalis]
MTAAVARGAGANQAAASVSRVLTAQDGSDLVGASASRRTSACLATSVNTVTLQRGHPSTGVTPTSPSPFT